MVQEAGNQIRDPEWARLHRAQKGEEKSWHKIIGHYRPRLAAMVLLMTGSPSATEDILQETFLRAMSAEIGHYSGSVRGFLGTIAYRLAVKESRRSNRHTNLDSIDLRDDTDNPLRALLKSERERYLADTIRSLSMEQRKVLILRFYGEFSYAEISQLIDVPLGTVKSRIFYAVKTCREILREKGILE